MKVSAVQLNLKNCKNYKIFYDFLENEVFQKLPENMDLLVFPENINLCLLFAKNDLKSLNLRSFYERIIDKLISLLDLSFIFKYEDLDYQKYVIISDSAEIAKKLKTNIPELLYWDNNKIHLGSLQFKSNSDVLDTLVDFFIISKSTQIFSNGSGFSNINSIIYNIKYNLF